MDELDKKTIKNIPQLPQRQDSLKNQLKDLRIYANKLGMYNSCDFLKSFCEEKEKWKKLKVIAIYADL